MYICAWLTKEDDRVCVQGSFPLGVNITYDLLCGQAKLKVSTDLLYSRPFSYFFLALKNVKYCHFAMIWPVLHWKKTVLNDKYLNAVLMAAHTIKQKLL